MLDGPLNTYQDFKNVFNAKNVGSKTNRRHAPNQSRSSNQEEVRLSKDSSVRGEQEMERIRVEATRANIEAGYKHSGLALEK